MNKKIIICVCVLVLSVLLGRHMSIVRFLSANSGETIHNNIFINGIDVGGMLPEEAEATLQQSMELDRKVIGFVYNNSLVFSNTFTDFGAKYDFSVLVAEAFSYGRAGTRRERYAIIRKLENQAHQITGEPKYLYDEAAIPDRLEAVRTQATIPAKNASMKLEAGQFVISEGENGRTPDIQDAAKQLKQILASQQPGQVMLKMYTVQPSYTAEHFLNAQSLLGTFTGYFQDGDESSRGINIRLAAAKINNSVLYPGEVFSTSEVLASNNPESGYARSSVIVDGRLVEDYGGGVCQVASVLYNALLFAELAIVQRSNHSMRVYYMEAGFDAAIAGDYMDLKFRNNTEHPILIEATAVNGNLQVKIHGKETRPANRSLAFVSELVETIQPEPDKVLMDENLPSGHVLVNTEAQEGYKYELFKIIFMDGQQVGRERVNTSIYRPVQGVVSRGP